MGAKSEACLLGALPPRVSSKESRRKIRAGSQRDIASRDDSPVGAGGDITESEKLF